VIQPGSAPTRRPLLPDADEVGHLDLTGCVLAESSNAVVSLLIRLKQVDGLNHNAVVVGPGQADGEWRVLEAIARGCVVRPRRLSTGYVIRFDDDGLRARIAEQADRAGSRGWRYDWASIAFHASDFFVWAAPVGLLVATLALALAGGPWWWTLAGAVAANLAFRLVRRVLPDATDRKICSELLLEVLAAAGVPIPDELATAQAYKATPIDVTRWLLGRADWGGPGPVTWWTRFKRVLGVRYSVKNPGRDGDFVAAV
jgi:hypothetical protein